LCRTIRGHGGNTAIHKLHEPKQGCDLYVTPGPSKWGEHRISWTMGTSPDYKTRVSLRQATSGEHVRIRIGVPDARTMTPETMGLLQGRARQAGRGSCQARGVYEITEPTVRFAAHSVKGVGCQRLLNLATRNSPRRPYARVPDSAGSRCSTVNKFRERRPVMIEAAGFRQRTGASSLRPTRGGGRPQLGQHEEEMKASRVMTKYHQTAHVADGGQHDAATPCRS